jgi:hypothetical protein
VPPASLKGSFPLQVSSKAASLFVASLKTSAPPEATSFATVEALKKGGVASFAAVDPAPQKGEAANLVAARGTGAPPVARYKKLGFFITKVRGACFRRPIKLRRSSGPQRCPIFVSDAFGLFLMHIYEQSPALPFACAPPQTASKGHPQLSSDDLSVPRILRSAHESQPC